MMKNKLARVLIFTFYISMLHCFVQGQSSWVWARQGEVNAAQAYVSTNSAAVVTDAFNNVYYTGYYSSSTLTLGSTVLQNPGAPFSNLFVAKYDANGNLLWAKSTTGCYFSYGAAIAVNTAGDRLYLTGRYGSFSGNGKFDSYTFLNGYNKMYLAQLDAGTGAVIWVKEETGTGNNTSLGNSLATDVNDAVYVAGNFTSTGVFGSVSLTSSTAGNNDGFLVKYDTAGNAIWGVKVGDTFSSSASTCVTIDVRRNVYLAGNYETRIKIDTVSFTGNRQIFVAKFDSSGNFKWARSSSGSGGVPNGASKLVGDRLGHVYLTGTYLNNTFTMGAFSISNPTGNYKVYFTKLDTAGNILFHKDAGVNFNSGLTPGIAVDNNNDLYLASNYGPNPANVGGVTLTSAGIRDISIAKYNPSGNLIWANSAGGTGDDYGKDVAVDQNGGVYVVGGYQSTAMNFGSITTLGQPTTVFVAKIFGGAMLPIPDFNTTNTTICAQSTVTFNDLSTGSPVFWNWTFEGGTPGTSNAKNPIVTYPVAGTYSVKLLVTNAAGQDSLIKTSYVTVNPLPDAGTTGVAPDSVCAGASAGLSVTGHLGTLQWQSSSDGISFTDIPNASQNIYQTPALNQTQYFRTTTVNGCGSDSSNIVPVVVNPLPQPSFANHDTLICSGDSAQICLLQTFPVLSWNTGDNTSCIYATNAGGYTVTVTDAMGCVNSVRTEMKIHPVSSVSVVVQGDTLSSFGAVGYQWYFNGVLIPGATGPLYIAAASGDYSLEITDANGCTARSNPFSVIVSGFEKIKNDFAFQVYPNPFRDYFLIQIRQPVPEIEKIEVRDMLGRMIFEYKEKLPANPLRIHTADWSPGVYHLRILTRTGELGRTLIR